MVSEKQKDAQKYAVFKIGEEDFGVEINRVVEILSTQKVHSIPDLPDFLSGVIAVRGQIIPLLDLRKRFGIIASSKKELIIVIKYDNEKIGVLVDHVKEIISLGKDEITSPPAIFKGLKRKYLAGIGKKDDGVIIILNVDDLLTSEERIILKEAEDVLEEDAGTGKTA
ncbi:MAG: chemotaxis protein CheW [Thermodesulfovibrionales bacterium]|jgi:purine-binding chemotaxis protein CheW